MSDLISRQTAIDAVQGIGRLATLPDNDAVVRMSAVEYVLFNLPSAQPEKRTEERTETHACDLISRQAAIDAILAVTGNSSVRELYEHVQEHGLSDMWSGGVNAAIDIIIAVPSAQPEEDCDTCKHGYFGDDKCNNCRVRYPSHYERRTDESY